METEQISKEEQQRKDEAKQKIAKLVEEFKRDIVDTGRIKNCNEDQVKLDYITPMLRALGWTNKSEVLVEKQIYGKRADYLLKIDNRKVMIVEAKKPSVNLKAGTSSGDAVARQAVSYAWHSKISIAVATDFEELVVYHGLAKPINIKNNLVVIKNKYFSLTFDKFIEQFELLWLLSRDSFKQNRLDNYLDKEAKKHKTVDKTLLDDLVKFRTWISKDINKYNEEWFTIYPNEKKKEIIDELTQKLIDRLIFIRSTEDRGLEKRDWLKKLADDFKDERIDKRIITSLKEVFRYFDKTYNSKLFEKGTLDNEKTRVSNEILYKVIHGLYYGTIGGKERYEFDLISVDLLGQIYERYLGTKLKATERRVKTEASKSKRKKMGIYYTPQYIVDYIVKNTVGESVKGKSIKEILELKILDPACGSGSFLQRAFDEVCNAVKARIKSGEKTDALLVSGLRKDGQLYLSQKISIMKRCIYGVDLDEQAVEICQLSLLLKLLEGEGASTKKKLLPTMKDNIQCGNSLIDDYDIAGDKAFNWQSRFKDVFTNGGFDVVIGNPPYVFTRERDFKEESKKYFKIHFSDKIKLISKSKAKQSGKLNLFALFLIKSITLLREDDVLSFIIPNTFLRVNTYIKLRKFILENCRVIKITDAGTDVFRGATTSTVIIKLQKTANSNDRNKNLIKIVKLNDSHKEDTVSHKIKRNEFRNNENYIFNILINKKYDLILNKIGKDSLILGEIGKSFNGIATRKNKNEYITNYLKNSKYKPLLEGKDIKKYATAFNSKYILYDRKLLHRPRDENIFLCKEKIITQRIGGGLNVIIATLDRNQFYTFNSTNNIILHNKEFKSEYILSLLNSKLINWYYVLKFTNMSILTVNISKTNLEQLPIRKISLEQQKPFIKLADRMLDLNKQLQEEKSDNKRDRIKEQIKQTDDEIDQMVYKLYGLTKEEIKIVEDSLK